MDVRLLSTQEIHFYSQWATHRAVFITLFCLLFSPLALGQAGDRAAAPLVDTTVNEANLSDENLLGNSDTPHQPHPSTLVRAPYIGIGIGQSSIKFDNSDALEAESTNENQTSAQLTLGVDINQWLSTELHLTDLGDVELPDSESLSFRNYGLSAVFYAGRDRAVFNRAGLTIFGRAGIGHMTNDQSAGAAFDTQEGTHWLLGGGLEYSMSSGIAFRVEGIAFEQRANYVQLGVLYRFGQFGSWVSRVPFVGKFSPESQNRKARMTGAAERIPRSNDGDGVVGAVDKCPDTPVSIAVGANGCALFNGVIDGLTFSAGSAELSPSARLLLESVANSLIQIPGARARVAAHTDSLGDADTNMRLSARRAFEVAKFLVQRGVSKSRLEARAFGEIQPIASNSTAEGRRSNRRVEIDLIAE